MFESIKALFRKAEPEQPRPPPTPEETTKAQNFMRLVLQTMDEGYETKQVPWEWIIGYVDRPSRWLQMAYDLDPHATVKDSDGFERTQDDIAGELLYNKGNMHELAGRAIQRAAIPITANMAQVRFEQRSQQDRADKEYTQAYIAAIQAVRFQPHSRKYLRLLYTTSSAVGDTKRAAATLKTLMEMDPTDLETLALL